MQRVVTVDQALARGNWLLKAGPLIVFFAVLIGALVLSNFDLIPVWGIGLSVVLAIPVMWLCWSVAITHWRIWALKHVRNTHQLFELAVQEKLIWPKGSWFERTEIRTPSQRAALAALRVRETVPDVWEDDPTVPAVTVIYWSKKQLITAVSMGTAITGVGIYMVLYHPNPILGWLLIVICVWFVRKEIVRLGETQPRITIDANGIALDQGPTIPWGAIISDEVVTIQRGNSSCTVLRLWHEDGQEELEIDLWATNKAALRHLLRTHRFRSGVFPST